MQGAESLSSLAPEKNLANSYFLFRSIHTFLPSLENRSFIKSQCLLRLPVGTVKSLLAAHEIALSSLVLRKTHQFQPRDPFMFQFTVL